ncbi:MAG: stage II sporulation protein R [Clostridiales bacterium]|jgi:stage II sporulation protein R|nr:stage II sporulation protein R [Clostridiales bacterium]
MKKGAYIAAVAVAAAVISGIFAANMFLGYVKTGEPETEYLRIHIRANSNSAEDQSVKYSIRDETVAYLTPVLAECRTAENAAEKIRESLNGISALADRVLAANGLNYNAKAEIRAEEFPTRIYGDVVLEQGVYNALILELGEAKGDNWWCIAFPPLCFIPAEDDGSGLVKYRSKIWEIIEEFYENR